MDLQTATPDGRSTTFALAVGPVGDLAQGALDLQQRATIFLVQVDRNIIGDVAGRNLRLIAIVRAIRLFLPELVRLIQNGALLFQK